MKVIKRGSVPTCIKRVMCSKCKSELEYHRADVHSDQRDGNYIICPVCNAFIADAAGLGVTQQYER